jgi:hypothetical protein
MRFVMTSVLVLTGLFLLPGAETGAASGLPAGPALAQAQSCGCADAAELANRLKAVQAVMGLLDSRASATPSGARFDANDFDSGLGEDILKASMSAGGIGAAIPAADFDRFSCDINTIPILGGSACTLESLNAQLSTRQQACRQSQAAAQGNDYWEGRLMSDVIRELRQSYAAEQAFINQQLMRLAGSSCQSSASTPPPVTCRNCLQYILESTRALPIVGRMRMFSNSVIPFTVGAGGQITGSGTIQTELDMSGSPCKVTGYNGTADILVSGQINGTVLNAIIAPRGASQTTSAAMRITCGDGVAQVFPQQQNYLLSQVLRVPGPGVRYTEETIDLGSRTRGAMQGLIVLRLYMSGN